MSLDDFLGDEKTVFAVIRALEVVGEAAKNIPDEIRHDHPHIPWREMAGLRDKLIHHYFGVDLETVWNTVTQELPTLHPQLLDVLAREHQRLSS